MHETPRRGPGDPLRTAAAERATAGRDAAVERHRELQRDERTAAEHARAVPLGQPSGLRSADADDDRYAGASQARDAATAHPRIGIRHRDDHAFETERQERVDAGGSTPVMDARLEGHVQHRAGGTTSGGAQRLDLGVRRPGTGVEALAHHPPASHEDGTDRRVRERPSEPARRQLERARHEAVGGGGTSRRRVHRRHTRRRPPCRAARRGRGFRRRSAIRSSSSRMNSCTSRKER